MSHTPDIDVLREMVRLAENRRNEEFAHIERVNRYNLALIAFSGSFLSLLITASFPKQTVGIVGAFLIISIIFSLIAIRPRTLKNGVLIIEDDIQNLRSGQRVSLYDYLLETAEFTEQAANSATMLSHTKKRLTIFSALFLALALAATYYLYVYA